MRLTCQRCQSRKDESLFSLCAGNKSGRKHVCLACEAERPPKIAGPLGWVMTTEPLSKKPWLVFRDVARQEFVAVKVHTTAEYRLAMAFAHARTLSGGRRYPSPPAGAVLING